MQRLTEWLQNLGFNQAQIDQIIGGTPATLIATALLALIGGGFWLFKWGGLGFLKGLAKWAFGLKEANEEPAAPPTSNLPPEDPKSVQPDLSSLPHPPVYGLIERKDHSNAEDLAQKIISKLLPDENILMSLWGAGGNGKTTLAAQAARSLRKKYNDRIVWVSADGKTNFTFDNFLDEIADRFRNTDVRKLFPEEKVGAVKKILSEAPTLVILDNFETIDSGEQQKCVKFLSDFHPGPALITTRESLGAQHAFNIHIQRMTNEEGQELFEKLKNNTSNPNAFLKLSVTDILQAAGHNPLYLMWLVDQIEDSLNPEEFLREHASVGGDEGERIFGRSFALKQLGDDGRSVVLALTLFSPDASATALCEIAGFGNNLNRLQQAVTKSIKLSLAKASDGNKRFYLEGITRDLAQERFEAEPNAASFRERFIAFFFKYAQRDDREQRTYHDTLDTEKNNLLRAIELAAETGDGKTAADLYTYLKFFLVMRDYYGDAARLGLVAVNTAKEIGYKLGEANCFVGLGDASMMQERLDDAIKFYSDAKSIYREISHRLGEANCLQGAGNVLRMQSRYEEAIKFFDDAKKMYQEIPNKLGEANCLFCLGEVTRTRRYNEAIKFFDDAKSIYREISNRLGEANCLRGLGETSLMNGWHDKAIKHFDDAKNIYQEIRERLGEADCLRGLGEVATSQKDFAKAEEFLTESLKMQREIGIKGNITECFNAIARLRAAKSEIDKDT